MTRFPRLFHILTGKNPESAPQARARALETYRSAVARNDTREIHRAWLQLKAATLGELRMGR